MLGGGTIFSDGATGTTTELEAAFLSQRPTMRRSFSAQPW
jgi:hypothetical protein